MKEFSSGNQQIHVTGMTHAGWQKVYFIMILSCILVRR
jgi:hypothetical protein